MRNEIDFFGLNSQEVLLAMAEGNPGAISAMGRCIDVEGYMGALMGVILHLDDMNIRGSQIWIAYKDYCARGDDRIVHSDEHVKLFIECVKKRDPMLVLCGNQAGLKGWCEKHKAVTRGGSYSNGRHMLTETDNVLSEQEVVYPEM